MCGIVGVLACGGFEPRVTDEDVARMRDRLSHRGPDGAGLWRGQGVVLGHRRLSVIDPTPAGAQPMVTPDGRYVITYNGELYNDAEVRADLAREGVVFRTRCDTETVLHAAARWGTAAASRLRGMYAFAVYDTDARRLLLARDPLGVKPLVYTLGPSRDEPAVDEVMFASEDTALRLRPGFVARPDLAAISGYLTAIRTTFGPRTLLEGVRSVEPGEWIELDLREPRARARRRVVWDDEAMGPAGRPDAGEGAVAATVRTAVVDSVRRHLRSDVPMCSLLSGGLDSTVVASVAAAGLHGGSRLRTYCAGDPAAGAGDADDFAFAASAAAALGTEHAEVVVDRAAFARDWPLMIHRLGRPLTTPNEVAIHAVAQRLRGDGHVVALSGEGADELFGGYLNPMMTAWAFCTAPAGAGEAGQGGAGQGGADGVFMLRSNAWMNTDTKAAMLRPEVWAALERDAWLEGWAADAGRAAWREAAHADDARDATARRMQTHLRLLRRVNLSGLLLRLDGATMLASVEGRTPFADIAVARAAERLAMADKFVAGVEPTGGDARTKIALRDAFAGDIPEAIVRRPKRSFPLPFQGWISDHAGVLRESRLVREVFTEAAVETVVAKAGEWWHLAWPMVNLALWSEAA